MGCDVYCALCGGPTTWVNIDKTSRKARLQEKREEALRAGLDVDSVEEESPSYNEGYDPEVVSREDVEWARRAAVLGFNPESTNVQKMFISGPGTYEDYGFMRDFLPCDDPNFPDEYDEIQCYNTYDANQPPGFPMHEPCLQLFYIVIYNKTGAKYVDKDLLYHIMVDLHVRGGRRALPLDYGEVAQEHDQYWNCQPGEELTAINPFIMPFGFTKLLRDTVFARNFALPPTPTKPLLDLDAKIRNDPFASLPYDLQHEILTHLSDPAAVLALCTASWPVHAAVRANQGFWRQALRSAMPWFWELTDLLSTNTTNTTGGKADGDGDGVALSVTDFKGLFLWAERETRPVHGLEGPFMGMANRRRMWGACDQLAALYVPRFVAQEREHAIEREGEGEGEDGTEGDDDDEEEAREIWEGAENPMMPVVVSPVPELEIGTVWKQWVRSFDEVDAQHALFETVWDAEGSLVGMSVRFSGKRRFFGKDVEDDDMKKEAVAIKKGYWITGLVLHLPGMISFNHPPGRLRHTIKWKEEELMTSIKGVTVITSAGNEQLGDTNPDYNQRLLPVSEGRTLVGVVGHVTKSGTIVRLGLVQVSCPAPTDNDDNDDEDDDDEDGTYPLLHRMLWKPTPVPDDNYGLHIAIWAHPTLRALPYTDSPLNRYQIQATIHDDLVPAEPLIWGATPRELRNLKRIECYQREKGREICGVRAVFDGDEAAAAASVVGNAGAVGVRGKEEKENSTDEWPAEDVVGFEVDGKAGEMVVEVGVMHDEAIKGIKLRTNQGREVFWGENTNHREFHPMVAPEGETIVGIAVGFGSQGGFSWERERYSYSTMSWIAALTMPL